MISRLSFTPEQLIALEKDQELLTNTLNLFEMIKSEPHQNELKHFVRSQLSNIRNRLSRTSLSNKQILQEARKRYYTFHSVHDL